MVAVRAMASERAHRYQSAAEMAADLGRVSKAARQRPLESTRIPFTRWPGCTPPKAAMDDWWPSA
jgi:hypothetical protein